MNSFVATLRSLGPGRLLSIGIVIIGLLGFFAFIGNRIATPPMALLYGGLALKDSSDIVARLDGLNIPYKLVGDGSSILVPQDQVRRLRLSMAEEGLPSGGTVGFEIFDKTDSFGTTSFVQNINRVRALEGELARTISSINNIASARVHLALPEKRMFSRTVPDASASITIHSRSGDLSRSQVRAIQNLVASAVTGLKSDHVSIVDERGKLLAASNDSDGDGGIASSLQDRRADMEHRIKRQVEDLISKYVGPRNIQVEVSAEIDFDRVTTNSETYDPDGQVAVSTQTVEESNSNQDASPGGVVSVSSSLPNDTATDANPNGDASTTTTTPPTPAGSLKTRTEETTNFENSKTITTQIHEAGNIKKLSVAVLIDGTYTQATDGTLSYSPRSQQELDQLTSLVRSAVGYVDGRDTVTVVNLPFASEEPVVAAEEPPGFLGLPMEKADVFRIAELLIFLIVGSLTMLLVVRPLINRLFAPGAGPAMAGAAAGGGQITDASGQTPALAGPAGAPGEAGEGGPVALPASDPASPDFQVPKSEIESAIDVATIDGKIQQSAVKKVGEIVAMHPDEATSILRTWIHQ